MKSYYKVYSPYFLGNLFDNVQETENCFIIETELPGVKKEDINIDITNDGLLTISGEKRHPSSIISIDPNPTYSSLSSQEENKTSSKLNLDTKPRSSGIKTGQFKKEFKLPANRIHSQSVQANHVDAKDVYLRFEAILYTLVCIGGFASPYSMLEWFKIGDDKSFAVGDLMVMATELSQLLSAEHYELFTSIVQIYTYFSSTVAFFQAIMLATAISSNNDLVKTTITRLSATLSLFQIIFNAWMLYNRGSIFTASGLTILYGSFAFYVVDFIILIYLTEKKK
eukprot:gene11514-13433_t